MSTVADPQPSQPVELDAPGSAPMVQAKVGWRGPIVYGVVSLISLVVFGLLTPGSDRTRFMVSSSRDLVDIAPFAVPSRLTAVLVSVLALGLTAWITRETLARRKVAVWVPVLFGFLVLVAFLVWVMAGNDNALPLTVLLTGALTLSVPLIFGSLAGLLCERSGIINIAIEGQLLAGAFLAVVVASLTGNPYTGLIAAPIAGAIVGLGLVLFAVRYRVDQIIVGVVLNVLVIGVTNYLFSTVLTQNPQSFNSPPRLPTLPIPFLSQIPVVGPVLFNHSLVVYLMYVAVAVLQVMVFRSRWGLRMRAVGEHPKAADTVGIPVNLTRIKNTVLGGAVAGLGGAALVAAGLAFTKELTAGRGYIALAAMILGRWSPKGALAAALLFGFADSLRQVLGNLGSPVPSQFLAMLPYLATIFAVAGLVGRVRAPAAEGIPYVK
ncbi:ABC transporter permease subunit [Cellulomonas cellasea]|uniref:ABC transporter permease n=2 Tax=Cellulomonas cellasea TaxID=43670 RepID=A0A0A0B604_9CELL|nr:ABC transporter permease [Cellulomonas cellasea DSM 20118]MBB2923841.1 simple sugar transport system permease protein [Cellulomonas cellasea]GEA89556.1 ABC transporter permease [Cellulomonas cellasea]